MNGAHLAEWQRRSFDISSGSCSPEQTAEFHRAHILSIQYAWASSQLSAAGAARLLGTYSERYGSLLDSDHARTGLNNYAESVLHLARGRRNCSAEWESGLTADSVLQLPGVRRMIEASAAAGEGGGGFPVAPADVDVPVGAESRGSSVSAADAASRPGPVSAKRGCDVWSGPQVSALQNQQSSTLPLANPSKRKNISSPDGGEASGSHSFRSAREQLVIEQQRKQTSRAAPVVKKSLGANRPRGAFTKFVSPVARQDSEENRTPEGLETPVLDERLKNFEPKIIELIMSEIMDHGAPVAWDDIAGLEFAKATIKEIVVWPMLRPDIFRGLRGPPKGILLFGPPGTGKTLIGKCIACQSGATFFSISASSLTSKWVGEGEKMVRALFAVARCHQPAVIFIDEIDSLLSQRSDGEHDSSRRIKTEFLVQLDGAATAADDRILVVGATNRPQEIDEAARRRLAKRLYVPLPAAAARRQIVSNLMAQERNRLTEAELDAVVSATDGFSGADMTQLCREAALGPIRSIQIGDIATIAADQVRPILHRDFQEALRTVRPSVSPKDLELYEDWNRTFGCGR